MASRVRLLSASARYPVSVRAGYGDGRDGQYQESFKGTQKQTYRENIRHGVTTVTQPKKHQVWRSWSSYPKSLYRITKNITYKKDYSDDLHDLHTHNTAGRMGQANRVPKIR